MLRDFIEQKAELIKGTKDIKEITKYKEIAEHEYFINGDKQYLDLLTVVSYRLGDYHLSYFYSKEGIKDLDYPIFYIYNALSLLKLGYYRYSEKLFWDKIEDILNLLESECLNIEEIIELFIVFYYDFSKLPFNIRRYCEENIDKDVIKLYLSQDKALKGDKNFLNIIIDDIIYRFEKNFILKNHINCLLGKLVNRKYYNNAIHDGYLEKNFFEGFSSDFSVYDRQLLKVSLPDFDDIKQRFNFFKYDYIDSQLEVKTFKSDKMVSLHIIRCEDKYLILDCGAYIEDGRGKEIDVYGFLKGNNIKTEDIEGVFISHAHLDHYGSINSLEALDIPIFMSKDTFNLISKMYSDGIKCSNINFIEDGKIIKLNSFLVRPFLNGHILGSMGFDIKAKGKRIIYTGDFCINDQYTVKGLDLSRLKGEDVDVLIMETTYGERDYVLDYEDNRIILKKIIDILQRYNMKILMPAFAIGRSQEIVCMLNEINLENPILIDGQAAQISYYYERNSMARNIINSKVHVSQGSLEEKLINYNIIIASSGMLQKGSTSYMYFDNLIKDDFMLIKTGFIEEDNQAMGIVNLFKDYKINLIDIPISAHANYNQLLEMILRLQPKNVVMVHGKGISNIF